ncbi:MAG: flippase-like domain-containing protein [Lentisphaeria bacterium]|nr:flippase-like domain-containing protein [Lentisphaeria bacterium]
MKNKCIEKISGAIRIPVKVGIALLVLYWICRSSAPDLSRGFTTFRYPVLLPVFLFSLLAALATAVRWKSLAQMIGIRLSVPEAFSLTMQGIFFSLVIPGGAIGGDMVKMAALTRHVRSGNRTEGIFSIFMDRVIGMIALFGLAAAILASGKKEFYDLHIAKVSETFTGAAVWWILLAACCAGSAAGIMLLFHRQLVGLPGIKMILDFADRKSSGRISRILAAADCFQNHRQALCCWILFSIAVIHLLPAVSMVWLLSGTGTSLPVLTVTRAVIIGNIAGLLPFFPGGIGARDAVTVALLAAGGCSLESAATAQLMATGIMIIFNLTGSVFFIFDRKSPEAAI